MSYRKGIHQGIYLFFAIFLGLLNTGLFAQKSCLDSAQLIVIDAQWEKALLDSDYDQLESLTAENFIWVHNHASLVDSKTSLLDRASAPNTGAAGILKSRTSFDVVAIRLGSTGVVTGHTIVARSEYKTNYHFMRTYSQVEGKCYLLANHTMAIPEQEE